ncbi:MAG: ABC transporter permease [Elusimicrobia bacterium]|nr:ABC transporter permease [Elusimicrobiota bacterium]
MRKFLVLVRKEVRELLSPQFLVPIILVILLFMVMGKVLARQNMGSTATETIAVLDLDRGAVSAGGLERLREAQYQVEAAAGADAAEALRSAERGRATALVVIPPGLEDSAKAQKPHELQIYRIFRGLDVRSLVSATMGQRAIRLLADSIGTAAARRRFPGADPAFIKHPITLREHVVVNGKTEPASIAEISGFLQSQTKFVPVVIFMVIALASQMVALTVASEKENKTLEILLSSPVPRRTVVAAKIAGSGLVAMCFTGAYMIGLQVFLNSIVAQGPAQYSETALRGALVRLGLILSPGGHALIGLSVLCGILCALAIALILGILADDVKAVQAANAPLFVTVLFSYLMTVFVDPAGASAGFRWMLYAIPFTHAFLAPQNALMGRHAAVWLGIAYQAAVFAAFVALASRLFVGETVFTARLRRSAPPRD